MLDRKCAELFLCSESVNLCMSRRLNEQIEIEGKYQRREQETLMVTLNAELCRSGMTEARMILYWVSMS